MESDLIHFGLKNLFADGFNGITFSILGMAIVYFGLIIISLYIAVLPIVLSIPSRLSKKNKGIQKRNIGIEKKEELPQPGNHHDFLMAIATAIRLEEKYQDDAELVTWKRHKDVTAWGISGRVQSLNKRVHTLRRL